MKGIIPDARRQREGSKASGGPQKCSDLLADAVCVTAEVIMDQE